MFTGEEDMQATALRARGWTISAIARHLERDPKTIRKYLNGAVAEETKRPDDDPFDTYVPYLRARLQEDPHVWATALYDEVSELGFDLSYASFTRGLRSRQLRPHCESCHAVKGRATIEIEHPPGEEMQWDWLELPEPPWGGREAHLLVGSLPCSGKFRAVFADAEDQPALIGAMDAVLRRFGGTAHTWRFDRMATVVNPKTGIVQPSFVPVAKHYGVKVVACPPRHGNRKGSVEKSNHYAAQRWWRTMTGKTPAESQTQLDKFCAQRSDWRPRPIARLQDLMGYEAASAYLTEQGRTRPAVRDIAALERLLPLPVSCYPATIERQAKVDARALVSFEGNRYGVPDGLIGATVTLRHRFGSPTVEISTPAGMPLVSHQRHEPGCGRVVRDPSHKAALEERILAAFTSERPCRAKLNRPPGGQARAEAAKLLSLFEHQDVVVSLDTYQEIVDQMTRSEAKR
jgi:transposase